jgi:hypothetical protein
MMLPARIAAALALILIAGSADAQDEQPSHVPVPRPADVNPAQLIRDRILKSQQRAGLEDIAKLGKSLDKESLLKIIKDNPQLANLIPGIQAHDPASLNRLHELLADPNPWRGNPNAPSPAQLQKLLQSLPQLQPGAGRTFSPIPSDPKAVPKIARPQSNPAEEAARRQIAHQVADLTKRLPEHLPDSLRNSPAVKGLVNRLSESAMGALGDTGTDGWDAQLARLESRWHVVRDWLPREMPAALRNIRMPDLSRIAPDVHMPEIDLTPPTLPSVPRFGVAAENLGSAANVFIVLIGVAVAAVVTWRLRGGRISSTSGGRHPLGPWPLDPSQVSTRAEIIRAFEYLSLFRCGESARSWHHRAIAEQLGGSQSDRRAAADRLATLYEQARYTPTAGGEPDWSTAREPLNTLAGTG